MNGQAAIQNMKKSTILLPLLSLFAFVGCDRAAIEENTGTLQIDNRSFIVDEEVPVVKSQPSPVADSYVLLFIDSKGTTVRKTYSEVRKEGWKLTFPAGDYTFVVRSYAGDVPQNIFDAPIYGTEKEFTILPGKTTLLNDITCRLLQAKVTVEYSAGFLRSMTGDGKCTVSISPDHPLIYDVTYKPGNPVVDTRAGYFMVNGESATMSVVYEGEIDGEEQVVTQTFMNVKACTWYKVMIVKKGSDIGSSSFEIVIDSIIDDEELG